MEFRPGDWHCPGCRNHNFARQSACRQCGIPRPIDGGMGHLSGGYGRPHADPAGALPPNFRPGDWLCNCGNHNFARNAYWYVGAYAHVAVCVWKLLLSQIVGIDYRIDLGRTR